MWREPALSCSLRWPHPSSNPPQHFLTHSTFRRPIICPSSGYFRLLGVWTNRNSVWILGFEVIVSWHKNEIATSNHAMKESAWDAAMWLSVHHLDSISGRDFPAGHVTPRKPRSQASAMLERAPQLPYTELQHTPWCWVRMTSSSHAFPDMAHPPTAIYRSPCAKYDPWRWLTIRLCLLGWSKVLR